MKLKAKKELHSKTTAELATLLKEKRSQLVKTKLDASLGKVKNAHAVVALRREIAIILTIAKEKEPKNA